MILNAIAEKLKRQSKDDFKGRHFEAWLIAKGANAHREMRLRARAVKRIASMGKTETTPMCLSPFTLE
jgi:transposase, IS6 family